MYKRRLKVFLAIMGVMFLVAVGRLWQLQVVEGMEHRREYERLLQRTELLPARRGEIIDRRGKILAMDLPCYDLCLDYRFVVGERKWIAREKDKIARAMGVGAPRAGEVFESRAQNTWRLARQAAAANGVDLDQVLERIVRRVNTIRDMVGMDIREQRQVHPVVSGLDDQETLALRAEMDETVGMTIQPGHKRHYPCGELACHVIGFTGQVDEEEQERLNIKVDQADWLTRMQDNYLDGDAIGKSGVEKLCENVLRGQRGYRRFDRSGGVESSSPAQPGGNVHLTLDIDLQKELMGIFPAGRNGCIVVLSVPRGEVLAMVSVPTFDLNRYRQDYPRLVEDEKDLPLLHRAVARCYPPGSTAKPITALAGLRSGAITTTTTFYCSGYLFPEARDHFRCWIAAKGGAHGDLDVVEGLKHSCNVFFYQVGNRMGTRQLGDWFGMFGFRDVPGTGLGEERSGRVPRDDSIALARMMAIGQGPIEATPLHVANAMAAIARGGRFSTPELVLEGGPRRIHRDGGILPQQAQAVQLGMYKVVNERGGTAYSVFHEGEDLVKLDVEICGKTGTAEVPPQRVDSNRNGRIDSEDDVVYQGDMAWFAGFAPYRNPQVAFAVVVEYVTSGGGGSNAGPVARKVVAACKARGYIQQARPSEG